MTQEMQIAAVGLDAGSATPVVLLRELSTRHRVLPLWVGTAEAEAIEIERRRLSLPRPPAHQLIANVIDLSGRRLEHVCVTAVRNGVVHAELIIDRQVRLAARASDAMAVALHVGVPILATELVLEQAALDDVLLSSEPLGDTEEQTEGELLGAALVDEVSAAAAVAELRAFLRDATPEDFA